MKQVWLVALLFLPIVAATSEITTSETHISIEGTLALIDTTFTLDTDEPIGNLTLITAQHASNVRVTIDNTTADCLLQAEFARCGDLAPGTHRVHLSYRTSYPLATVGENTVFRHTNRLPYPANQHQVSLKLPTGYIIPRERGKDDSFYLSPTPQDVYSDGQRIILHWEEQGQELPISAVTRRVINPPYEWMLLSGALALIAAGTTAWAVFRKPQTKVVKVKTKTKKKPKEVTPSLIDNEQQVVNYLKEHGETWQKQIQQATGFSKAKVSRVIRNLEARGVIIKTPYGNTNKISLKEQ